MSLIHRLRERPDHHRRNISLAVAGLVTAIIFGIWITVRPFQPGGRTIVVDEKNAANAIDIIGRPAAVTGENQ